MMCDKCKDCANLSARDVFNGVCIISKETVSIDAPVCENFYVLISANIAANISYLRRIPISAPATAIWFTRISAAARILLLQNNCIPKGHPVIHALRAGLQQSRRIIV